MIGGKQFLIIWEQKKTNKQQKTENIQEHIELIGGRTLSSARAHAHTHKHARIPAHARDKDGTSRRSTDNLNC